LASSSDSVFVSFSPDTASNVNSSATKLTSRAAMNAQVSSSYLASSGLALSFLLLIPNTFQAL
jgi:hypothetical protein